VARHMSHPPSPRSTCTHSPADVLQRCIAGLRSIGSASSGRALDRRSVEIIIVLDCAADGAARGGPARALQRSASSWYDHALHIARAGACWAAAGARPAWACAAKLVHERLVGTSQVLGPAV